MRHKTRPTSSRLSSGPASDPDFPDYEVTVDVSEGDDPMQVDVTVAWDVKGGQSAVALTTLRADY